MSNLYAPQPAEDSSRVSLPPAAGERIVIKPEEEIVSKIGTLADGGYTTIKTTRSRFLLRQSE